MDNPAPAPQRFGKYDLVHEIGHGGMAVVHRARYQGMGGFSRPVVIKRILPELAGEEPFVKMFVEEARLSALLEHPNIVQIHDFGTIDGSYFLAMEYIEGIPLHRFQRAFGRRRPVSAEAASYIIQQVCVGLHYAHRLTRDGQILGIVHRDVSPANVMLSVHGGVKLLDFGIAKAAQAIDREETRTGTLKGKWSYMSPEQVVGQPVTARSDIFSTGIVLWELLTGRRLFKARTDFLTLSNVVQARVIAPTSFRPELPRQLDAICARALARKPKDRYATAEELAEELEALLVDRPFSPTQLASMVAEVQATGGDDEAQEPTASDSAAANSARPVTTHGSRPRDPQDLLHRRPWVLPLAVFAAVLASTALVIVYLLVPSAPPKTGTDDYPGAGVERPSRLGAGSGRDLSLPDKEPRIPDRAVLRDQETRVDRLTSPVRTPARKVGPPKKTPAKAAAPTPAAARDKDKDRDRDKDKDRDRDKDKDKDEDRDKDKDKDKARPKSSPTKKELPNLKSGDLADPYR